MEMNDFVCVEDLNGNIHENYLEEYKGNSKNVVIPSQFEVLWQNCFSGNSSIESVEIPESVQNIQNHAFHNCPNLKTVKIPDTLLSVSPDAFGSAEKTAEILKTNPNYIEKNGFIFNKAENFLLFALDSTKDSFTIPEGISGIGANAFIACKNLKEISIPEGITAIYFATFMGCENLTKVHFPSTLERIGIAAFALCNNLKEFNLPEGVQIEIGNEILC